jgi:guanine deaminase
MRSICTLTLLKALGDLASKYDVHVQSHVSETPHSVYKRSAAFAVPCSLTLQVSMIHEMYPDLGGRDVAVFDSVKLLTRKTCLGHGAYLRDDEVRRMAAVGASVAVCPYSSMLYLQAISPIARWVDLGLTVGLGTDIAAGYNNSMLGVGRLATLANHAESFNNVQRELPSSAAPEAPSADLTRVDWVYAFHLATAGGAAALVLEDKIGKFEVGMQFDALLVDVDVDGQAFEYWEDEPTVKQVERWWNTGDDRNLRSVWVQGRSVLNDLGAKDQ